MSFLAFLIFSLFTIGLWGLMTRCDEDTDKLELYTWLAMPTIAMALLLDAVMPGGLFFNAFQVTFGTSGGADILKTLIVVAYALFLVLIGHFREFELLDYGVGFALFLFILIAL